MRFFHKKKDEAPAPAASMSEVPSPTPSEHHADGYSEKDKDEVAEATVTATQSRNSSTVPNAAEQRIEGIEADLELEQQMSKDYPQGIKLTLITIALALSVFCLALDNTIISTAIPRITDQ